MAVGGWICGLVGVVGGLGNFVFDRPQGGGGMGMPMEAREEEDEEEAKQGKRGGRK